MTRMESRRLRRVVVLALLGTAVTAGVVLRLNLDVDHDVAGLMTPGAQSPAAPVIRHDFPSYVLHEGVGHDGQAFYVIAREPMHLRAAAGWTDRPRYRLQRILLPVLAWSTHPQGGGRGLALSLWTWAALGVALTGLGAALLAHSLGASQRAVEGLALLVPFLPAAFATLDLSVADELALGLVLVALALDRMGHERGALATAVLAVLAKEAMLLVLVGWALTRGRRVLLRLVGVPALVAGGWWLVLRVWLSSSREQSEEFSVVRGLIRAVHIWFDGDGRVSGVVVAASVAAAVFVLLRRGLRSPLGGAIAIQLALVPFLSAVVLAGDWNGPRATAPLLLLSIVAMTVPAEQPARVDPAPAEPVPETRISSLPAVRA
jgi:hypothetical protein